MTAFGAPITIADALAIPLDRLDAQLLLLHTLGKPASNRAWLLAHDQDILSAPDHAVFMALVQRRATGEPVAYLTGHKEFYGLDLRVDRRVLVPRPDTETLVDWALDVLPDAPAGAGSPGLRIVKPFESRAFSPTVSVPSPASHSVRQSPNTTKRKNESETVSAIDLGTGSGAVALALKHTRPGVKVSATDFSTDALEVAQSNARHLDVDVSFSQGSWLSGVHGRFHLIVSNPPYIAAQDQHLAALTHEPLEALASGADGLDDIRQIISQAPAHLHPGGWLLLEHGFNQASPVRELLRDAGFIDVQSRQDLSGIERCSGGRWPAT